MGFCNCSIFCCALLCVHYGWQSSRWGREKRAGCFVLFVVLVSRDGCVARPRDATGLFAVCDCGIS